MTTQITRPESARWKMTRMIRMTRNGSLQSTAILALTALLTMQPIVPAMAQQNNQQNDARGYDAAHHRRDIARYAADQDDDPDMPHSRLQALVHDKIKYVFVIYQENRSFDSYFGTFPGAEGLYSQSPERTPGFTQTIVNTDGSTSTIQPFLIGPKMFAADTDDVDHSHPLTVAKMDLQNGVPQMDKYAVTEELKYSPTGNPSLKAKQFGELAMAHEDCDTVPLLWNYADRFVLFDHVFEEMTGPSTPGNLSIIGAQSGQTQWALHPEEAYTDNGAKVPGVPVLNDNDPFWGSQLDTSANKMPVNPADFINGSEYGTQINLTYATLPLTLQGKQLAKTVQADEDPASDLADVDDDVKYIAGLKEKQIPFGWYEEGYDKEVTDMNAGPTDATGTHASYVTHHNGPQYFGYVSNNPEMRMQLHGLGDFFDAVDNRTLPQQGGVFYVKGGFENIFGMTPANPDAAVQKSFLGDDDHPGYSDAQISEAMVAEAINKIVDSPYWSQSAIIINWDDSEGDYDHVRPPIRSYGPDGSPITDGPRVPLMVISPYGRAHVILNSSGSQASVVKFIDKVYNLTPLALLPDERKGRELGEQEFHQSGLGPQDALTPDVSDLLDAFSPGRLTGRIPVLPPEYAHVPEYLIHNLPEKTGFSCNTLGIIPTDRALGIKNNVPADFNPRPKTDPSPVPQAGVAQVTLR